jgi:uncharacterized protein YjbJ (UPF0337 family)
MTDQRVKGTLVNVRGRIEAALGSLTGNRRQQAGGIAHQVEGDVRRGVGDVQEAAKRHEDHPPTA